jgi:hypothetical protein
MFTRHSGLSLSLIFVTVSLLTGCGGLQKVQLTEGERAGLKNYPGIRAVHREPPVLTVTTAGRVLLDDLTLGTAGGVKNLAKLFAITDPAIAVKESLVLTMEKDAGFKKLAIMPQPLARESPDTFEVVKAAYKSGVVLDVMTLNWGGMYFPTDWTHYRLGYLAQARLVRLEDGKVLWSGWCNYSSDQDGGPSPSMDELNANNGALIKKIYAEAGKRCSRQLADQFFNRGT